uniref:Uncharacterized protein n=1 Tax=Chelonoidis abingdonii TaxID=106734 RepID=A0A8C0IZ82_CHEAB
APNKVLSAPTHQISATLQGQNNSKRRPSVVTGADSQSNKHHTLQPPLYPYGSPKLLLSRPELHPCAQGRRSTPVHSVSTELHPGPKGQARSPTRHWEGIQRAAQLPAALRSPADFASPTSEQHPHGHRHARVILHCGCSRLNKADSRVADHSSSGVGTL